MNHDTNKNVFTVSGALEEEYLDQLPESKTENQTISRIKYSLPLVLVKESF